MFPKTILTIAGSDCSGGAGIQADIKTISALQGYAASVITAITAQNTVGVQEVYPLDTEVVEAQLTSILSDLRPAAIKIGMVHNASIVGVVVDKLRQRSIPVIFDPVMISTSGRRLMTNDTLRAIRTDLFPLCTLVTPNLHEASLLAGAPITTVRQMIEVARTLAARHGISMLIKGGHLEGEEMCDVLCHQNEIFSFPTAKVDSPNLHGTGCTLSSAIATLVGQGEPLPQAVAHAKAYTTRCIVRGKDLEIGSGNGPLWHF